MGRQQYVTAVSGFVLAYIQSVDSSIQWVRWSGDGFLEEAETDGKQTNFPDCCLSVKVLTKSFHAKSDATWGRTLRSASRQIVGPGAKPPPETHVSLARKRVQ